MCRPFGRCRSGRLPRQLPPPQSLRRWNFFCHVSDLKCLCRVQVDLSLWDTAGQEDYDRLRPLSYPDADVVLICFSADSPDSLENVTEKWWPEVRHFCPDVPVIVVGTKTDLRADERTRVDAGQKPVVVRSGDGREVAARIAAVAYHECSALNNDGVRELFQTATKAAVGHTRKRRRCRPWKLLCLK